MDFKNKKILITGGSSGIGKAIIAEFYEKGTRDFAVVGRNQDKMKALNNTFPEANFLCLQGDVSKLEDIKRIFKTLNEKWSTIDVLVNNAGAVSAGALEDISDEDIIAQQNVNTTGLILFTKYALPLLKNSDGATIMNVSSGLGLIGMPFYAPYAASKAAVKQFSESLRRELQPLSIHVMTVYPSSTDTPMMETASTNKDMDNPKLVAEKAVDGLMNHKIDVILGGKERVGNVKFNFENPGDFDEKVKSQYEAMKKRAASHRAM